MTVVQLSVGLPKQVEFEGKQIQTSIFKSPVDGRVRVGSLNITGDRQADLSVHGGRDKAIYAYSQEYYQDWARQLNVAQLEDSQFGENLTVTNCLDTEVLIGARYQIGEIEVTVTQPRIPCFKLGIRLNDQLFPKLFWQVGRLGFYCRVEKEGSIAQGDKIKMVCQPKHGITIRALYKIVNSGNRAEALHAIDQLADLDSGWIRRLNQIARNR